MRCSRKPCAVVTTTGVRLARARRLTSSRAPRARQAEIEQHAVVLEAPAQPEQLIAIRDPVDGMAVAHHERTGGAPQRFVVFGQQQPHGFQMFVIGRRDFISAAAVAGTLTPGE